MCHLDFGRLRENLSLIQRQITTGCVILFRPLSTARIIFTATIRPRRHYCGIPFCWSLDITTALVFFYNRLERFPALPPNRADVMPAALACGVALMDHAGTTEVRNSLHNLRCGIAAELLAESG